MKKILSTILCLAMVVSMSVTAFAAEIGITGSQTTNTTVTYGPGSGYTVVIPESIAIPYSAGRGDAATVTVSASNVMIDYGTTLSVSIAGQDDGKWQLVDASNNANTIEYIIGSTAAGNNIVENSTVLSVPAGDYWNSTKSATLHLTVNENVVKTGNYSDTLTFTVDVDSVEIDLITFTVDGISYYAEDGMTWEEFIISNYNPDYDCNDSDKKFGTSDYYTNQVVFHKYDYCTEDEEWRVSVYIQNGDDEEMELTTVRLTDKIIADESYKSDNP